MEEEPIQGRKELEYIIRLECEEIKYCTACRFNRQIWGDEEIHHCLITDIRHSAVKPEWCPLRRESDATEESQRTGTGARTENKG
jgi:hypothetical protein